MFASKLPSAWIIRSASDRNDGVADGGIACEAARASAPRPEDVCGECGTGGAGDDGGEGEKDAAARASCSRSSDDWPRCK